MQPKKLHKHLVVFFLQQIGTWDGFLTLCHADFWGNNMMFHCDESGKPIKVKILDFQVIISRFFHAALYTQASYNLLHSKSSIDEKCKRDLRIMQNKESQFQFGRFNNPQMMSIGHPCIDIGYFLYVNTDSAFRRAHLPAVLDAYYDAFVRHSDGEGMPMTKEEFQVEFWKLSPTYLFAAFGVSHHSEHIDKDVRRHLMSVIKTSFPGL